jgi:hypothetical protein
MGCTDDSPNPRRDWRRATCVVHGRKALSEPILVDRIERIGRSLGVSVCLESP